MPRISANLSAMVIGALALCCARPVHPEAPSSAATNSAATCGAAPAAASEAAQSGSASAAAKAYVLPDTEVFTLPSTHVGVTYEIAVSLPHDYAQRSERFPVVYLLDAEYSFALAHQIENYLAQHGKLPELILVGIGYPTSGAVDAETAYKINRTRDYTPVASDKGYPKDIQKYSGGAEAFARFIEQELVTAIDGRYPTVRGDRTIVGHSYGSLFATWAILTNPALFRRAILVSPSYWYADEWIFDYEAKRAADLESLPVLAYLTAGRRETSRTRDIVEGVRRMTRILRSRGYAGLTVRTEIEWREEHYSVFPGALSTGLRFVFGTL